MAIATTRVHLESSIALSNQTVCFSACAKTPAVHSTALNVDQVDHRKRHISTALPGTAGLSFPLRLVYFYTTSSLVSSYIYNYTLEKNDGEHNAVPSPGLDRSDDRSVCVAFVQRQDCLSFFHLKKKLQSMLHSYTSVEERRDFRYY